MPQVVVPSRTHVYYVPLDDLAAAVVLPAYARVLQRAGLTSDVSMYPSPRQLRGESQLDLAVAIKAQPDHADVQLADPEDLWPAVEAFARSGAELPGPNQFGVPRYTR